MMLATEMSLAQLFVSRPSHPGPLSPGYIIIIYYRECYCWIHTSSSWCAIKEDATPPDIGTITPFSFSSLVTTEEVILNEDRTTEEERRYIMEARKRALQKRKKLRTLGKSRSTESEDEENEEEEGMYKKYLFWHTWLLSRPSAIAVASSFFVVDLSLISSPES